MTTNDDHFLPEDSCANHPERSAIEHCEVCGKSLCGYCLYYTDDGQRLCEKHAQQAKANGLGIIPPAVYADGIIPTQVAASERSASQLPQPKQKGVLDRPATLYHANNQDLNGFISMLIGVFALSACCGGTYCLPFLGVGLGILALLNAKDAVEPRRTRQQAWVGIITGGVIVVGIIGCIGCYALFYGSLIASVNSSSNNMNPVFFPTSTIVPQTNTPNPFGSDNNFNFNPNLEPLQRTATAKAATPLPSGAGPATLLAAEPTLTAPLELRYNAGSQADENER